MANYCQLKLSCNLSLACQCVFSCECPKFFCSVVFIYRSIFPVYVTISMFDVHDICQYYRPYGHMLKFLTIEIKIVYGLHLEAIIFRVYIK